MMSDLYSLFGTVMAAMGFKQEESKTKSKPLPRRKLHVEPLEPREMLSVVTLESSDLIAKEAPASLPNYAEFVVRRDVAEPTALTVNFELLGTAEGKVWYRKKEGTLLSYDEGADRGIRSLEYCLNGYEYKESSRKLIEGCLTFLRNNGPRMEYKRDRFGSGGRGVQKHREKADVSKRSALEFGGRPSDFELASDWESNRWSIFWNAYKRHHPSPSLTQST